MPSRKITVGITVLLLLLVSGLSFSVSTSSAAPDRTHGKGARHTFAVIPFYTPEKIWSLYSPFVDYLSKSTGQGWELKLYSKHDDVIEDMCSGKVSAALLGPVPLGRVNSKCGVKPLLAAIGNDGTPSFHSVILTNSPSIASLKDLKGKKIGFLKGSTAAHILPLKMLKDEGLGMASFQPVFMESQDRIISALLSGELAAAGVKESLAKKFSKGELKIIAVSPPLPNFSISTSPSFSAAGRKSLSAALIRLKPLSNPRDRETMKSWDDEVKYGFTLPDAEFLPSVIRVFTIFREIQNDN